MSNLIQQSQIPQTTVDQIISLYNQGQLRRTVSLAENLAKQYPNAPILYDILGAAYMGLRNADKTIASYQTALLLNPNHTDAHNNMGMALYDQGKFEEAVDSYQKAVELEPDFADAHFNLGNALQKKGDFKQAIESYKTSLAINPDDAEVLLNYGDALQNNREWDAAIKSYKQATKIKPDFAEAYFNMGKALRDKGELDAAIVSYKQTLKIKPDFAEAYFNMGNALRDKGDLDATITSYKQAIKIKPNYAEAYNNMGIALKDKDKVELNAAINSYKQAIKIKPNFADAYWNLHGASTEIPEAKNWIKKCLQSDDNHLYAKLMLAALNFYEGDEKDFETLINSPLWDHPFSRSFSWIFSLPELPKLCFNRWQMFDFVTAASIKSRPFYEYGVWRGDAFKYLIKTFKKGYGFDTFEGLPEEWHHEKVGTYSSDGNIPKVDGGEFVVGKFEDTLPKFFSVQRPVASVINFDADLYSSTICALNHSKPVMDTNTILIFDEFIINEYWEEDEYKALEEFCSENNFNYQVLAVSFYTKQVAVKLTKHN